MGRRLSDLLGPGAPDRGPPKLLQLLNSVLPRRENRVLPTLSGVALAAAFPPFHLIIPSFLALTPLVVWLLRLGPSREDEIEAGRGGFLFGLVYFGLLLHWIAIALVWFSSWAIPAYLSVVLLFAWGTKWVCRATHRLQHHTAIPGWVAFGIAWTALEWGQGHLPGELAFPWLGLGHSLTGYPVLAGAADLVGARGLTLWLALANALVAAIWVGTDHREATDHHERTGRQVLALGALYVGLVALPMLYGFGRARTLQLERLGRVAIVQPNIPEELKLSVVEGIDSTFVSLERLTPTEPGADIELFVWPEMTFVGWVETDSVLSGRVRAVGAGWTAPVLFGAIGSEANSEGPDVPYNSAFLMNGGLRTDFRYDKRRLVPMVERVPFLPVRWFGDETRYGGYGRGTGLPLAATAGGDSFGVLICSESIYPGLAREYTKAGARFLVNITNDAWFGREPWYARTGALWQHPTHLVMRAIENRIGVVRVANTGFSFFVDPLGRVSDRTALFEPEVRSANVWSTAQPTMYTRVGDVAGWFSAISLVLLLGWVGWARRFWIGLLRRLR
jgi:apolipoprotein N-acyltransferase